MKMTARQINSELSKSPEVSIFFVLCHEDFRHRGSAPSSGPPKKLQRIAGLSTRTQQRAIVYLPGSGRSDIR